VNQAKKARDAYEVLNVRRDAHQVVVRAAYRALAGLYHPDSNSSAHADRLMSELNTAYAELRTPERRDVYDRIGSPSAVAPPSAAPAAGPPAARKRSGDTSAVVDFGRYHGWTVAELAQHDPDYLRWLGRHSSGIRYRREIAEHLAPTVMVAQKPATRPRWRRQRR